MPEKDKEKKSILGLGLPESASDPNAWRPSKVAQRAESMPSLTGDALEKQKRADARKSAHTQNQKCEPESQAESRTANGRDSKAEQACDLPDLKNQPNQVPRATVWRPSKTNEERLNSLSPGHRRKRFAMSSRTRLLFTAVLFACGAYFFVKVWMMPEAGELHVALVIAGLAMVLLLVSAIIGAARRRGKGKRGSDDESILRL